MTISKMSKTSDASRSSELLPIVYEKLRLAAKNQMAREKGGHSLQATALVHEAYLRLSGGDKRPQWNGAAHFCAALTEIMRRILIESARRRNRLKRGGGRKRQDLDLESIPGEAADQDLFRLDEALDALTVFNASWAELVKLRFFAGMTLADAARVLAVSPRTADSWWAGARGWLQKKLSIDIGAIPN
jgi:RNA polymerase sigma factor (TIGR02999 family)